MKLEFPQPGDLVEPRSEQARAIFPHWKVTARFIVRLSAKRSVACVRVRCGHVLHMSLAEFHHAFRKRQTKSSGPAVKGA